MQKTRVNFFTILLTIALIATGLLILSKFFLEPKFNHVTDMSSFDGDYNTDKRGLITESMWEPYYGGGFGIDNVIAKDGDSIRISTGLEGWYGARVELNDFDLRNKTLSLSVRVDNWDNSDRFMLILSSDSDFNNYFGVNFNNYFARPASGEWLELSLEPSVFEVIEGNPDWSKIKYVAVRVIPKADKTVRVWLDELEFVPKKENKAVVSLVFDDGFASIVPIAKEMSRYNYLGTAFVIPEFINESDYLNQEEVDYLANLGWDISGHDKDPLIDLLPIDVDARLALVYKYLDENKYKGREHFAYPNGMYNQSVRSQTLEYFTSARTIDGFSQPTNIIFPSKINAITVSKDITIPEVIKEIEKAQKDNSWLILVWHNFTDKPEKDVDYTFTNFNFLLSHLHDSGVEVLPYSEAYKLFVE